jgi:hypothetical protein
LTGTDFEKKNRAGTQNEKAFKKATDIIAWWQGSKIITGIGIACRETHIVGPSFALVRFLGGYERV